MWVFIFGIWSSGCFWLAIGLVLFRNPADSLSVCHSDPQTSVWCCREVAERTQGLMLFIWGRGRGAEGREVAVLHNSTFQFLNAGHSLTEISSRRLSLANYLPCIPFTGSGQSCSIHRENRLYINPLVLCLESGTVSSDTWKYGIMDLCVSVCSCGSALR